jgi:hypothetical protein
LDADRAPQLKAIVMRFLLSNAMLVKNECRNTPLGLLTQVRRSLGWIHPLDLDGIAFILLMDEIEEPGATALD